MSVTLNLKNRRCRNRAPHEAHSWRGLNTRGAGYYCVGRDPEYTEENEIAPRTSENAVRGEDRPAL